jgi:hypothetical protein
MLADFLKLRPYVYHCCGEINFESIRRDRALRSATNLLNESGHEYLLRKHRKESVRLNLPSGEVEIRDNAPLRLGSLALQDGISLEDFLLELNSRVFLWPGNAKGPISVGRKHFEHYRGIGAVHLLKIPTAGLLVANADRNLSFTYCNSGAARHQQGLPVQRGKSTFVAPLHATKPAAAIRELTFVGSVRLPDNTEWAESLSGPWQPF